MHYRIAVWGLDLSNLILRPLLEHFFHIYGGLLQHLIPDVGVDVGGGLIVGMADDLHCDQRIDSAFVEHGDVVVPEKVRGQTGLDLLQDIARAVRPFGNLSPVRAARGQHELVPLTLEGCLGKRTTLVIVEDVLARLAFDKCGFSFCVNITAGLNILLIVDQNH